MFLHPSRNYTTVVRSPSYSTTNLKNSSPACVAKQLQLFCLVFTCFRKKKKELHFLLLLFSPLSTISSMRTRCVTFFAVVLFLGMLALSNMFSLSCPFSPHWHDSIIEDSGSFWSHHAPCGCNFGIYSYSLCLVIVSHGFCTSRLHVFETCY
jgi:hypothetical protein